VNEITPAPSTHAAADIEPPPRTNPPRLRRTLLGAAIGALLAMSIVPYATHTGTYQYRRGYLPIYDIAGRESVNVPQLTLNISFAALAAAIAFNLSRRFIIWTVAIIGLGIVARVGLPAYQEEMRRAAEREETIAHNAIMDGDFDAAKQSLLKASNYWWWKGWWEGAQRVSERASDEQAMRQEAAAYRAGRDEERARALLRLDWLNDRYGESIAEAKRLLLEAAGKWHIAERFKDEQRVRAWENQIQPKNAPPPSFDPSRPYQVLSKP
jgi:hypothetical protein